MRTIDLISLEHWDYFLEKCHTSRISLFGEENPRSRKWKTPPRWKTGENHQPRGQQRGRQENRLFSRCLRQPPGHDASLQFIPLRRYNTGKLSDMVGFMGHWKGIRTVAVETKVSTARPIPNESLFALYTAIAQVE